MALQSREILQTFVWWGAQICPLPYKVQLIFVTFAKLYLRLLKMRHFQNLAF